MKLLPSHDQQAAKKTGSKNTKVGSVVRGTTYSKLRDRKRCQSSVPRKSSRVIENSSAFAAVYKALDAGVPLRDIRLAVDTLKNERKAVQKLSKRRGRAKGGGQSSKAKGRAAVALVRQYLLSAYHLGDDDVFVKATSQGGCDVHLSPYAAKLFPFAIEVKGAENLNIWKALAQASVNATPKNVPAILFFKRAHSPLFVALRADVFLSTVKQND